LHLDSSVTRGVQRPGCSQTAGCPGGHRHVASEQSAALAGPAALPGPQQRAEASSQERDRGWVSPRPSSPGRRPGLAVPAGREGPELGAVPSEGADRRPEEVPTLTRAGQARPLPASPQASAGPRRHPARAQPEPAATRPNGRFRFPRVPPP